jgi:hypothetical protein
LFAPLETLKVSNGLYDTPSGGSLKFLTGFDCSTFNRTQNIPLQKKGVAFPSLIQRLALADVVGIKGFLSFDITGMNIISSYGGQ